MYMLSERTEISMSNESTDSSTDCALLEQVSAQRSHDAFKELYERYEKPAFSLAHYLTRNMDTAREITQDAMLDLWRSPPTKPVENVRAWIMRMVANKSINLVKKRRNRRTATNMDDVMNRSSPEPSPPERTERKELLGALKGAMEALSDRERSLLSLYYGGGLSQVEIGEALAIPQRTVSMRIQKAVETLRVQLRQSGCAGAVPALSTGLFFELLSSEYGPPIPSDMRKAVFRKAARVDRTAGAGPAVVTRLLYGVLGVTVLVGFAWYLTTDRRGPSSDGAVRATPVRKAGAGLANEDAALPAHWSFETEPAPPGWVVCGSWKWTGREPNGGRMEVPADSGVGALVPVRLPDGPAVLESEAELRVFGRYAFGVYATDERGLLACHEWSRSLDVTASQDRALGKMMIRVFALGKYLVIMHGERLWGVRLHRRPLAGSRFFIMAQNTLIRSVSVRAAREGEIPEGFSDPTALLRDRKWFERDFGPFPFSSIRDRKGTVLKGRGEAEVRSGP